MVPLQDYCFSGFLGHINLFFFLFFFLGHIKNAEGAVQSGPHPTGMSSVLWISCCRAHLLITQCCDQAWLLGLFRAWFRLQLIPGTTEEKQAVQMWQQDGCYCVLPTGTLVFSLGA